MAATEGQLAKTIGIEMVSRGIASTEVITRGDVVSFDANGFVVKADETDTIVNGFGVAHETATGGAGDGDVLVEVCMGNTWVYCLTDDIVKPGFLVKVSTGTKTGQVDAHAKPANANAIFDELEVDAARDYFGKTVGRYMGHEGEEQVQTDTAAADVIKVRLGL